MGNQHEIRQVAPTQQLGVAIPIREGCLQKVSEALAQFRRGHFYTYVAGKNEEYTICNLDFGDTFLGALSCPHFIIQSGGKMWCGYDAFRDHIAMLAKYLEDALFFVGDEQDFIDEYTIRNGQLFCRRVLSGYWLPVDEYIRVQIQLEICNQQNKGAQ